MLVNWHHPKIWKMDEVKLDHVPRRIVGMKIKIIFKPPPMLVLVAGVPTLSLINHCGTEHVHVCTWDSYTDSGHADYLIFRTLDKSCGSIRGELKTQTAFGHKLLNSGLDKFSISWIYPLQDAIVANLKGFWGFFLSKHVLVVTVSAWGG